MRTGVRRARPFSTTYSAQPPVLPAPPSVAAVRKRALAGTCTAFSSWRVMNSVSTRQASPRAAQSARGLVSSRMTRVRCSCTPRAETLVKPPGSTRVTRACSAPSPPQRSTRAVMPGARRTASVDRTSASISSWAVSPTSIRLWPAATGVALCRLRRSTTPLTGESTGWGARAPLSPAAPSWASVARAAATRAMAACSSAWAAASSAAARVAAAWAWSSASCEAAWPAARARARLRLACASWWAARAAAMRWLAAACWLWPLFTSASAWARLRSSSKVLAAGAM